MTSREGLSCNVTSRRERAKKAGIPVVNCNNILQAVFAPISFHKKFTNPNCKHIKGEQNTLAQKIQYKMYQKCCS